MLELFGVIVAVVVVLILQEAINRRLYWDVDGEKVRRYREKDRSHRESWLRRR